MIITIDGPSGTGKSTVAKKVAENLEFAFFDTGAMYRAVTWCIRQKNIKLEDEKAIEILLDQFVFHIQDNKGSKRYFVGETDVTEDIRTREITGIVSAVSALPIVRQKIWGIQRQFGEKMDAVFEGRDMGSTVFPHADLKIFLNARPEVRAERRYKEFQGKVLPNTMKEEEVLREIIARDAADSSRALSPLKKADTAIEIDTSDLTIEQVVGLILTYYVQVKQKYDVLDHH
ncbi:MAG: (d)CMP kinase [Simkania sp.]|nr:(d)CMP kinase [Simkania sp.]